MAKKTLDRGVLITLEGIEGCGKTTHAKLLCEYLKSRSYDYIHTREPGGTKVGEKVRGILLDSDGIQISDLTELYLFEAARAQIVSEVIRPNLNKKRIIVCDRFSDATFSYQGYGGKVPLKIITALDNIAAGGIKPDLTILLDIDTLTGLKRARPKGFDRMEKKSVTYHKRVRRGYIELARINPERIKIVKVMDKISDTQDIIRQEVEHVIQRHIRPR